MRCEGKALFYLWREWAKNGEDCCKCDMMRLDCKQHRSFCLHADPRICDTRIGTNSYLGLPRPFVQGSCHFLQRNSVNNSGRLVF